MNQKITLQKFLPLIIFLVLGVLVFIVWNTIYSPDAKLFNTDSESISENEVNRLVTTEGYHYDIAYKENPDGTVSNDHLIFISPTEETINIPDSIWFRIAAASAAQRTGQDRGKICRIT